MNIGLIVRLLLTPLLVIEALGVFFLFVVVVQLARSEDLGSMLGVSPANFVQIFLVGLALAGGAVAMALRPRGGAVLRFWSTTLLLLAAGSNVVLLGFGMMMEWSPLVAGPLFALLFVCAELWFDAAPAPPP